MIRFSYKVLVYTPIIFVSFVFLLTTELGLPDNIRLIFDLVTVVTLFTLVVYSHNPIMREAQLVDWLLLAFALYCVCSTVVYDISPYLSIWRFRTVFRYYIFFYACRYLLDRTDIEKCFRMLEWLFTINLAFALFEYFVQGYSQDYLGGLFGVQQGSNGYLNVYLCLMLCYAYSRFLDNKFNICKLLYYLAVSLIIGAMAEIKLLYIEAILIFVLSLILWKPSRRIVYMLTTTFVAFIAGIRVFSLCFPSSFSILENNSLSRYLNADFTKGRQMGRTNAFEYIDTNFFSNGVVQQNFNIGSGDYATNKVFGFGFGSANSSIFKDSLFANVYESTAYNAFTFASVYLEMGIVGLILYISIFIAIIIHCIHSLRTFHDSTYIRFVIVFSSIVLINVWYGNLFSDFSYYIYFVLSIPYIITRKEAI